MEVNKELLLDKDYSLKLLKRLKLPSNIKQHCILVSKKAKYIAHKIKNEKVNANFIEIGALIHDIGRIKTHNLDHGIVGGKIARELGYPEEIAKIVERHVLGGLDTQDIQKFIPQYNSSTNLIPQSIEEKIVCLADKYYQGSKEVSIDKRFNSWFKNEDRDLDLLIKSKKRIEKILRQLKDLM